MKDKIRIFLIPLFLFALTVSACGTNSGENVPISDAAEVEEQNIEGIAEERLTEGTGFCANEFFPLRSDKTWSYTISSGDMVDPYSITFKDITDTSFTTIQTFEKLTNEVGWECSENGMLSSSYANMNYSGADVIYETLDVNGIALPPEEEWQIGKSWNVTYKVSLTINTSGVEVEAEGEIITSSQITSVESITVPAGTYNEAYRVDSTAEMIIEIMGTQTLTTLTFSDWYVRSVGLVKSASDDPNMLYLMELVSFE